MIVNYIMMPKAQQRGILAVWKSEMFTKLAQMQGRYTISVDLAMNMDNIIFRLTIVYGPTNTNERANFYAELQQAKLNNNIPWMVAGDINVTLQLRDKSNTQHTSLDMRSFQHIVNSLELLDLQLQGRKYTWCNEREVPSYVRLDIFLISVEWTRMFPNTIQKTLPNTSSDHYPLMCTSATKFPCANIFRIENNWLKQQDFIQMVNEMWHQQPIASSPQELHHKMVQTRKAIIKWKKEKGNAWPHQLQVCNEWLQWLDIQAEQRPLNAIEKFVRILMKGSNNYQCWKNRDGSKERKETGSKWEIRTQDISTK
jgi:hypothetical protein